MKDAEKGSTRCDLRQSCVANEIERFAVPVTAETLRMAGSMPVLPSPQPFPVATTMLQQEQTAISPTHASHFPEHRHRIGKGA
jgi:hypothetical protein